MWVNEWSSCKTVRIALVNQSFADSFLLHIPETRRPTIDGHRRYNIHVFMGEALAATWLADACGESWKFLSYWRKYRPKATTHTTHNSFIRMTSPHSNPPWQTSYSKRLQMTSSDSGIEKHPVPWTSTCPSQIHGLLFKGSFGLFFKLTAVK